MGPLGRYKKCANCEHLTLSCYSLESKIDDMLHLDVIRNTIDQKVSILPERQHRRCGVSVERIFLAPAHFLGCFARNSVDEETPLISKIGNRKQKSRPVGGRGRSYWEESTKCGRISTLVFTRIE